MSQITQGGNPTMNRTKITTLLWTFLLAAGLAVAGCSTDDDPATEAGTDTAGGGSDTKAPASTFTGGNFQLTTHEAKDECLDDALSILFMPDGTDKPYDLQFPTELPAYKDLPKSFTMKLQAPFSNMEVMLEQAGEAKMKVKDSKQTDLVVDSKSYGDCNVDMTIDADLTVVDDDNIELYAKIKVGDWKSSGDTCPAYKSDPCNITLTMRGKRIK
jgi:hypothetical protein